MTRFAVLLICCLCCPAIALAGNPESSPRGFIDPSASPYGMSKDAIEKILRPQNTKFVFINNLPGCEVHYLQSQIVVRYSALGIANAIYREPK